MGRYGSRAVGLLLHGGSVVGKGPRGTGGDHGELKVGIFVGLKRDLRVTGEELLLGYEEMFFAFEA